MNEVTYEILDHIGVLSAGERQKEVNLVSWCGRRPKIDIREWDADHVKMSRGATFTDDEARKLAQVLSDYYGKGNI